MDDGQLASREKMADPLLLMDKLRGAEATQRAADGANLAFAQAQSEARDSMSMNSRNIDFAPRDERSDSQLWAALCAQDDDATSGLDKSRLSVVDSEAAFTNAHLMSAGN